MSKGERPCRPFSTFYIIIYKGYTTPCWIWQAGRNDKGYGVYGKIGRKTVRAHRYSYERFYKIRIQKGLEVDHLCKNKDCVNPEHMELVSRSENMLRIWR